MREPARRTDSAGPKPCRSCGKLIRWVRTPAGKAMPIDATTTTVWTLDGKPLNGHLSHFATCPNAASHRKPREKPAASEEE